MKRHIILLFTLLAIAVAYAAPSVGTTFQDTKTEADNAYQQKDYPRAVNLYERFLREHPASASAHYNLGNCYYRLQNYPQAVLHYERALKYNPADDDARFNLSLVRTKTEDQFGEASEMFFIRWGKQLRDQATADTWAVWGLVLFGLSLCALLVYLFSRPLLLRKCSFFGAIILFATAVAAHCFGAWQHTRGTESQRAVVMQTCPLREGPSDSAKGSFDLHPGTGVRLVDTSIRGWMQVELSDGRTGWIEAGKATIV